MIHLSLSKQIGKHKHNFTFLGEDLFEVVMESQQLGFGDIYKCGICEGDSLRLRAYETKEDKYHYVKVVCNNPECRGQLTFGKAKKDGAYFFRRNEDRTLAWEKMPERDNEE